MKIKIINAPDLKEEEKKDYLLEAYKNISIKSKDQKKLWLPNYWEMFRQNKRSGNITIDMLLMAFNERLISGGDPLCFMVVIGPERIATQIKSKDLIDLFAIEFAEEIPISEQKKYLMELLDFSSTYLSGLLTIVFSFLSSSQHTTFKKAVVYDLIKTRLLACGPRFLQLLEKNPPFFSALAEDFLYFIEILKLTDKPLHFLKKLLNNTVVTNWVTENLFMKVALLLDKEVVAVSEMIEFLALKAAKVTYGEVLKAEIKQLLRHLNEYGVIELNALFTIMDCKELRRFLKLNPTDYQDGLSNPFISRLIERLLIIDNSTLGFLNEPFFSGLICKSDSDLDYPHLRDSNLDNLHLQPIIYYSPQYSQYKAFTIANSSKWLQFRRLLSSKQQLTNLHPILRLRYYYALSKSKLEFKDYVIADLLSDGISNLFDGYSLLPLFCDLATGKHYLKFLHLIKKDHPSIYRKIKRIFLERIFSNVYYSVKLAHSLDRNSLVLARDLLSEVAITDLVDCEELLCAILFAESSLAIEMLRAVAVNSELIIKLLDESRKEVYYRKNLRIFLSHPTVKDTLFTEMQQSDILKLLNQIPCELILYILNTAKCQKIADKFNAVLSASLHQLTNEQLLTTLLSKPDYGKSIMAKLNFEKLILLLQSPTVCMSRDIVVTVLEHPFLPVSKLSVHTSILYQIACENKYVLEIFFQKWSLFSSLRLSHEDILKLIGNPKMKLTLEYLLEHPPRYFYLMFGSIYEFVPNKIKSITAKFKDNFNRKHSSVVRNPERLAMNSTDTYKVLNRNSFIDHKKSILNVMLEFQSEIVAFDNTSCMLNLIYLELQDDFDTGLEGLTVSVNKDMDVLSNQLLPVTLLLHEPFCDFLLSLMESKPKTLILYLLSFPKIHKDTQYFFNLSKEMQQIGWVKILNKLKYLTLSVVEKYFSSRNPSSFPSDFVPLFIVAANNYPQNLNAIIQKQKGLPKLSEEILSGNLHQVLLENQMVVLLLLASALKDYSNKEEVIIDLIQLLNLSAFSGNKLQKNYIVELFPFQSLLKSHQPQLMSYFLKQSFYVTKLTSKNLLQVVEYYPELYEHFLIYKHLSEKLDAVELNQLIADRHPGKEITEIAKQLSKSLLTEDVIREHVCFVPGGDLRTPKSSTQYMLKFLQDKMYDSFNQSLNEYESEKKLADLIFSNQYLPFISLSDNSPLTKLIKDDVDIIINLSTLIVEKLSEEQVEQFYISMVPLDLQRFLDLNTLLEWRFEYHSRDLTSEFETLIQEELTIFTGIKKCFDDEQEVFQSALRFNI